MSVLNDNVPKGLSEEKWCVTLIELTENKCINVTGAPVVFSKEDTTRGQYFEQHFVLGPLL